MANVIRSTVAGLRWLLVGAVVAAVVAGTSLGVATVALGHGFQGSTAALDHSATSEWTVVADPGIDRQRAVDAAVAAVPGSRVVSSDFDTEHGRAVWEVEVVTPDGAEHEVTVDAHSGEVVGAVEHD